MKENEKNSCDKYIDMSFVACPIDQEFMKQMHICIGNLRTIKSAAEKYERTFQSIEQLRY